MPRLATFLSLISFTVLIQVDGVFSSPAQLITASSSLSSSRPPAQPTGSHVVPDPNTVVDSPQSSSAPSEDFSPSEIGLSRSCSGADGGVFDSRCWEILNVGVFLNDPVVGWNRTVPVCGIRGSQFAQNSTETCCMPSEPWSTCFLRLATRNPGLDCTSLESPYCSLTPLRGIAPSIAPQVHYVVRNIISTYNPTSISQPITI